MGLESEARKESADLQRSALAATLILIFIADWRQSHGASPICIVASPDLATATAACLDELPRKGLRRGTYTPPPEPIQFYPL